jgi:hypothetical protein
MPRRWAWLRVVFRANDDPMNGEDMWTWNFWRQTVERAVKTAAQFALVFTGAEAFNILDVDLVTTGGFALAGAVVSILTSVASSPFTEAGTPSLVEQD